MKDQFSQRSYGKLLLSRLVFAAGSDGIIYQVRFDSSTNKVALVGQTTSESGPDQMSFLNGHLFAVSRRAQNLYVYNFTNGALTSAPGSPVPLGFALSSVAALQH